MTLAYIGPKVSAFAGLSESNSPPLGRNPYISQGERKDPTTFPITTSIIAAASSPPAFLVITTLDAIVVGMQLTTTIPTRMLASIVPERTPPATIMIWIMTRTDQQKRSNMGTQVEFRTKLNNGYENKIYSLHYNVQTPVHYMLLEFCWAKLHPVDEKDQSNAPI